MMPTGQSGTEEHGRRSSADEATGGPLTCESRGVFQNHALKHAYTLACTRKITIEEQKSPSGENRTRVSRPVFVLAARPGNGQRQAHGSNRARRTTRVQATPGA
jgi:hypothetical protein